jgi:hypothetical protein
MSPEVQGWFWKSGIVGLDRTPNLRDEEILEKLLALNLERAKG